MRRILLFFSLILLSCLSFAQQKNLERAEEAIADSFYERGYKLTLEAMEDEVTTKDALSYYLNAICIYHLLYFLLMYLFYFLFFLLLL